MKVLHINQSDISGGAAIAGYRLHKGLLEHGLESKILAGNTSTLSGRVRQVNNMNYTEKILSKIVPRIGFNHLHQVSSFDIKKDPWFKDADIINFHNLHTGFFSYLALPSLTKKKAFLTLHDMWSFTGHCAYSYDCEKWKTGCGSCPYPETYPSIQHDVSSYEWQLKKWIYKHSNLEIVAPSTWLYDQASQSILGCFPIHYIPNGIDTNAYKPMDRKQCREILDLPLEKFILLFSADNLKDSRKGADLLTSALQKLPLSLKQETYLVTFGNGGFEDDHVQELVGIKNLNLGYIASDKIKSIIYSAADLFLLPSRADNLPIVLQESMACGTPMVSFNVGGIPDLVQENITGYLAKKDDPSDFSNGIRQMLDNESRLRNMSEACREIAVKEFSLEDQILKYIEIYKSI